jgi:hypothetical protein
MDPVQLYILTIVCIDVFMSGVACALLPLVPITRKSTHPPGSGALCQTGGPPQHLSSNFTDTWQCISPVIREIQPTILYIVGLMVPFTEYGDDFIEINEHKFSTCRGDTYWIQMSPHKFNSSDFAAIL